MEWTDGRSVYGHVITKFSRMGSCLGSARARKARVWSPAKIDRQVFHPTCRLCGDREETVGHTAAECKKLAENQYKNCRHKVAQGCKNLICSAAKT